MRSRTAHSTARRDSGALRRTVRAAVAAGTALLVVAGGVLGGGLGASASTGGATAVEAGGAVTAGGAVACVPVAIIAFPNTTRNLNPKASNVHDGSPHRYANSGLITNGWEGDILERLFTQLYDPQMYNHLDPAVVPVIGMGPSDATHPYGYDHPSILGPSDYERIVSGAQAAVREMTAFNAAQRAAGCTVPTRFIVAGAGLSAGAARFAARLAPRDVATVVTVGDWLQKPHGEGTTGSGDWGNGAYRIDWAAWKLGFDDYYTQPGLTRVGICDADDSMCNFETDDDRLSAVLHIILDLPFMVAKTAMQKYFDDAEETTGFALRVADVAQTLIDSQGALLRASKFTANPERKADIVLAVDSSGSMHSVLARLPQLSQKLVAAGKGASVRLGIVEYRDAGQTFAARTVLPLDDDDELFVDGLNSITAGGEGPDAAESVYSGVAAAAGMAWRPDAARAIVVVGDSDPHDPEPDSGLTADAVADLLGTEGTDGSPVSLYQVSTDGTPSALLGDLVDRTGGRTFDSQDDDGLDDVLADVMDDIADAPSVTVTGIPFAVAGTPVALYADGADEADGLTWSADVDADGITDLQQTSPAFLTTFEGAGDASVTVTATDARGRRATGSLTIPVVPAGSLSIALSEPGIPLSVQVVGDAGDTTRVRVTAVGGPSDATAALLSRGPERSGSEVIGSVMALPAGWSSTELTVPRLSPGTYHLTVASEAYRWGTVSFTVPGVAASETTLAATGASSPGGTGIPALALLLLGVALSALARRWSEQRTHHPSVTGSSPVRPPGHHHGKSRT